ncbi:1-8-cineole synthase 1- chloroplastic [Striga hermonthica]|uniref:1-8-cineole synthase 1- chloroplastic n=1 Tax=Striga hermonthica TaxID=68872 RepID=A0A9N7MHF1_STRHE|nr:1-8-cineole synthase 1- chloroplastic [Striga hermonthica]
MSAIALSWTMAMATTKKQPIASNHFSFDRKLPSFNCLASSKKTELCRFKCKAQIGDQINISSVERRSGNYYPSSWDYDFIQSLSTEYEDERYLKRASELIEDVKMMLDDETMEDVGKLELIDDLERLGISYHFEDKINEVLKQIHEVFDRFKNENGEFKTNVGDDAKGLLQLYKASFLLMRGEDTLELAIKFSTKYLKKKIENEGIDQGIFMDKHLSILVRKALELPLHWRVQRPNTRWFINSYEIKPDMNPIVLELAKLDFNIVQATHQRELKRLSRWWEQTRLTQKMPFARDRLVECYFWATSGISIVFRWDIEAIGELPDYMQICFLALDNFVDEAAYNIFKEKGFLALPHLRKSWADLCRTYLQEATWHSMGYKPKLQEYINNAWISISGPVILTHAYFFVTYPIHNEAIQSLYDYHNIVRCSSMILRLANDLGTSSDEMKRGDVPKAIQCYMNETGASVDEAQAYIRFLIHEAWKEMNEERVLANCGFQKEFVNAAIELGRMAQYMYQYGDGHGMHFPQMKYRIPSLLFEPMKL